MVSQPGPPLPADGGGRRYQLHLFVCTSESACALDGPAAEIRKLLKSKVRESGLKHEVRVNQAGCLGQCGHGPMMVVYPEGIWYSHLELDDAKRVWGDHVLGGRPVEDLRFKTTQKGSNVLPMADPVRRKVDTTSAYFDPCTRCPEQARGAL